MNDDRRKALVAAAVIRAKLLEISVAEALETALEKAGAQVNEHERRQLLRDAERVAEEYRPDKSGQLELVV